MHISNIQYRLSRIHIKKKIGKLTIDIGCLEPHMFPYRIKIWWGSGAGYIGGWTAHLRLTRLPHHCNTQSKVFGHPCYHTPIVGFTRNGNRYLL